MVKNPLNERGLSGGCQCGAIRYRITSELGRAGICHCRMCQKAFGNFGAALVAVPRESLAWTRGRPAEFRSSPIVARGFCSSCGTPLYMLEDGDPNYEIAIGSLDDPNAAAPLKSQVGTESKLVWFSSMDSLPGRTTDDDRSPEDLKKLGACSTPTTTRIIGHERKRSGDGRLPVRRRALRHHRALRNPHICHCRMCQKAFGNYFAALVGTKKSGLSWTRGEPAFFRSSEIVARGFCRDCGTPLSFAYDTTDRIAVSIGSLDHPEAVTPARQYGMEAKLPAFDTLHDLPGTRTEDDIPQDFLTKLKSRQHPDHP